MSERSDEFHDEGDEVVAEVRAIRHRISERFGHDPYQLVAHYIERQEAHADRLIHAPEAERTGKSAA